MKTLRKSMLLILVAVFSLTIGLFAAACGGSKVSVSFDFGDGSAIVTMEGSAGSQMQLPQREREGYFFDGWYDNAQFTGEGYRDSIEVPEQDKTFYAHWLKGYNLTLEMNGGSLGGSTENRTFSVPETGNLLEWIGKNTNGAPQRGSLSFGAWLNGEAEIGAEDKMPSSDLTLKAGFKVGYTVEVYAQTAPRRADYARSDELSFTASDYVDKTIDLAQRDFEHYVVTDYTTEEHPAVTKLKLADNASQNAFCVYLDRATYSVIYNVNLPTSGLEYTGKMGDTVYVYGESAEISKNYYEVTGYRFAGWSTNATGDVEYYPGEPIESGNYILYALWDKGYADVFGSSDYIFFPRNEQDPEAVLRRAGYEFSGVRGNLDGEMNFVNNPNGSFVSFDRGTFLAKLIGDRFSLSFASRANTYTLYNGYYLEENQSHLDENVKLTLDSFNTATLTENNSTRTGTYEFDSEQGEFVLKISGVSDRYFSFGMQGDKPVFSFYGKEEGVYNQFIRIGRGARYALGTQTFTLDGYGNVTRTLEVYGDTKGTYEKPDMSAAYPVIAMHLDDGTYMRICLSVLNSDDNCVMVVEDQAKTFHNDNGDTLTLDGIGAFADSAVYKHGDTEESFDYYYKITFLGTYVYLTKNFDDQAYGFALDAEEETFEETDVEFHQLLAGNGRYNYLGDVYLATYSETDYTELEADGEDSCVEENPGEIPEGAKKAALYMLQKNGNWDCVYEGYSYIDPDYGISRFQATRWIKGRKNAFYTNFLYSITDISVQGSLFYYHLSDYAFIDGDGKPVDVNGEPVDSSKEGSVQYKASTFYTFYTPGIEWDDRFHHPFIMWNQTTLISYYGSGMEGVGCVYNDGNGNVIEGSLDYYVLSAAESNLFGGASTVFSFTYRDSDDPTQLHSMYLKVTSDEEVFGSVFEMLDSEPFVNLHRFYETAQYTTDEDGVTRMNFSDSYAGLYLLGDENRTAYYYRSEEDALAGENAVKGVYEYLDEMNGYPRYTFTPEGSEVEPFEFTIEEFGEGFGNHFQFFHVYQPENNKTYTFNDGSNATLQLDGYGSYARYTDKFGNVTESGYIFGEDKTQIALYTRNGGTAITLTLSFAISEDDPDVLIVQKEEERMMHYMLSSPSGSFPPNMEQAIVVFDAESKTVKITQYPDWWEVEIDKSKDTYPLYAIGTYNLIDEEEHLYDFTLVVYDWSSQDITGEGVHWRVKIENGQCILMEADDVCGSYRGQGKDTSVFYIDGWGEGCYIDEEGNRYDGYHTIFGRSIADAEGRYAYGAFGGVEEDPNLLYAVVYDTVNRTFKITNKPEDWATYYASDFGAVEFCQVFAVDNEMIGYWFIDENGKLLIYEMEWTVGWVRVDEQRYILPHFDDPHDKLAYDTRDFDRYFYRWMQGTSFKFTGEVVFDAFDDMTDEEKAAKLKDNHMATKIENLTLEFVPDGTALLNAEATLHFEYNGTKEDLKYTVVVSHPQTMQNSGRGYLKADAYYDGIPYYLELNYDMEHPEKNSFVLHAAGGDILWTDFPTLELPDYFGYQYGTITSGRTYSIGPKEWKFSDWLKANEDGTDDSGYNVDSNMLITGVAYATDTNGKLLVFSKFYDEIFGDEYKNNGEFAVDEEYVVTHDATLAAYLGYTAESLPIYEVLVKGTDDYTYSIWIEKLTDSYGGWSSVFYAINLYTEYSNEGTLKIEEEDGTEKEQTGKFVYRAWQFLGAYYASFVEKSIYTLDLYFEYDGEDGNKVQKNLMEGYDGAAWFDNEVILYHTDEETGLPVSDEDSEVLLVKFEYENPQSRIVKSATHTTDVKYVTLNYGQGDDVATFGLFLVKGEENKIDSAYMHVGSRTANGITTDFSNAASQRVDYQKSRPSYTKPGDLLFYFGNPVGITVRLSGDWNSQTIQWELGLKFESEDDSQPDKGDTDPDEGETDPDTGNGGDSQQGEE